MTPGELDQLIDLKREVLVSDGVGGDSLNIVNIQLGVWAKVRAMSGKEQERHDQLNSYAMVTFIVRYRNDLRHDDRIIWNGQGYNIRYIEPASSRDLYRVIQAEMGVAL